MQTFTQNKIHLQRGLSKTTEPFHGVGHLTVLLELCLRGPQHHPLNLTCTMVTMAMKTGGGHRRFWWKYQRRSVSQGRIS